MVEVDKAIAQNKNGGALSQGEAVLLEGAADLWRKQTGLQSDSFLQLPEWPQNAEGRRGGGTCLEPRVYGFARPCGAFDVRLLPQATLCESTENKIVP